jgi:aminoglycoside 2''-phosphotransferase
MSDRDSAYTERIHQLRPDLQIRSVELNTEGLLNDVVIVNRELVFRFAKDDRAKAALESEAKLLQFLGGRVSLLIPQPVLLGDDVLVYPLIDGDALTRDALQAAIDKGRMLLAEQLGRFLAELHGVPLGPEIPETLAPVSHEAWTDIRNEVQDKVFPLLMPSQRDWAERLLDEALVDAGFFSYEPKLIHGDLAPYHILYSDQAGSLRGVIDFGVAGRGDPANDLAMLLHAYGETTVNLVLRHYPEGRSFLKRARFYAQAVELEWALQGVKTGERFWFLAHIGGARDIGR